MRHALPLSRRLIGCLAACLVATLLVPSIVQAERPTAAHLFPKNTVAYFRVTDASDFSEQMKHTALGKIGEEDGIKQLVSEMYAEAKDAYAQIEDEVGLSLDEILKLPQGEIAIGVIQPEEGQPQLAVLIEVGDYEVNARKLIDRGVELAKNDGAAVETEVFKEVKLNIIEPAGNDDPLTYFIKDSTVILANSTEVCRQMLESWSDVEEMETLADNNDFATIMKRCSGQEGERPQLTWFVDPINIVKMVARGQNAGIVLAFLPATGVDGIRGMGGSAIMNTENFEGVQHMHVLLDSPRSGLVDALALSSGDTDPEGWVAADSASYITMHWDFNQTYLAIEKVYDSFTNEGALHDLIVDRFDEATELSFFEEVLPAFGGRVSMSSVIVEPARWNSQSSVIGIELADAAAFRKTFLKIVDRFPALEKKQFGSVEYYTIDTSDAANEDIFNNALRRPEPSFCILGDYLIYTDSVQVLEDAIIADSDSSRSLAKEADYKRVVEQVKEHLGEERPGMFIFSRPDKPLKMVYDMVQADSTKQFLSSAGEDNPFVARVSGILENSKLPPFSTLSRHIAPTGAVMTSDETGFHYMAFSLKPESE